jgi:S-layer protein
VITQSETHAASDDAGPSALTTGTITVTGGTSVTVNSLASGGAGDEAGDELTIGQVTVNGKGTVTSVSVTQSAATAAWAAAGDNIQITNGVVAITDNNTATKTDAITTVSLANFGNSTIVGNALTTLNLTGGGAAATASGTVGISQSASLTTAAPTALDINMTSGRVGIITDTNNQYTTLNVVSAAAATIAGLDFTNATTLNVSGAGVTTISASTDLAKVTAINSTGGGLALTGTLAVGTTFTGGAGKESVDVGATTKAITTGAGDDTITISATALGTAGSVDAGEGSDTLSMTAANAVTASAATTFETAITGFEKLSLAAVADTGTVNLANLDDLNDVAIAGVAAATALTLSGASSGINLRFADATQTSTIVTLANSGSADVANVFLTTADEASVHAAIDLTGFETLNIASADTDTNTVAASNAITALTAGDAKTVVVTGNAGLALAAGFTGTKVTSFDASAVTAGAVTYTTGALAAAATIAGGAGADTLSGAAAAIAGVTINAGAGNDAITGSATKASTLNGDAGNDTITGGAAADVIDGGAGTNTYVFSSANVVDQAGFSTTTGAVINLSSAALTQSGVFTATGAYLTTTAPTVAAGTSTYLFNGESSTNASVVDTLANIQNVTGTNLADYIVGSDAANVIIGGDGIDVMTGGAGADTFAVQIAEADLDVVTDFSSADFLSIDVGTPAANTYFEGAIAGVAITDEIVVLTSVGYANVAAAYVDGTFAAASEVTIIFFDTDTNTAKVAYDVNGETAGDAVELVNLTGITSLALLISAFATGSVIYS